MPPQFDRAIAPAQLRLFSASDGAGDLSARLTLRQFFDRWFLPVVLPQAAIGTVQVFRTAIDWWEQLSWRSDPYDPQHPYAGPRVRPPNPPLSEIDDLLLAQFYARLRSATYKRGPLASPRPLAAFTATKIVRAIGTILRRAGPKNPHDPKRRALGLIEETPYVSAPAPRGGEPKAAFTVDQARALWRAAPGMPAIGEWTWRHYQSLIALAFYTGHRSGTLLGLQEQHCRSEHGHLWLDVPAELVPKTGKPRKKLLHPTCAQQIRSLWTGDPRRLLLPWPCAYSWLARKHFLWQDLAGIPLRSRLSLHAWRRSHANEMAALGLEHATKIAQMALDHSDAATTSRFYLSLEAQIILRLPDLSAD